MILFISVSELNDFCKKMRINASPKKNELGLVFSSRNMTPELNLKNGRQSRKNVSHQTMNKPVSNSTGYPDSEPIPDWNPDRISVF
jgi:hypothetical protein